uniref:GRAM domain-containing protein n=1 Tax=Compsopogon caeruleus TaxID=31354 RepID=A0A7S1XEX1_9RHOD
MIGVCAKIQGKSLEVLKEEFDEDISLNSVRGGMFSVLPEDRRPRDFPDFVIMTTLQARDSFNVQNARSWMFNVMDRTGEGTVLREEFVRYASLMQPVADPAVADLVFRELVNPKFSGGASVVKAAEAVVEDLPSTKSAGFDEDPSRKSSETISHASENKPIFVEVPSSMSIIYETWKNFVDKLKKIYNRVDAEWETAKELLGLDPVEPLIKGHGAIDHSDTIPVPGRLFLSERYLVFLASMGSKHYVIRLGVISGVERYSLPVMLRDCVKISIEPETRSALKGEKISSVPTTSSVPTNSLGHTAANAVRLCSISGAPLIFSFHEFRSSLKRDMWIAYLDEMVAAHRLHAKFGFGSKGRAPSGTCEWPATAQNSPFRQDPSPPLFAVGAAVNILRTRSLKTATGRRSFKLLLFSHPDTNRDAVKWYVDSIQAFDGHERRSWVTRAIDSIAENMEINSRIYDVNEEEPFDVAKLGEGIARFYDLCRPMIWIYYEYERLMQWRNPPATILAAIVCFFIAKNNMTHLIPSFFMLAYAGVILAVRVRLVGFKGTDAAAAAASADARSQGMFELMTQVHDALHSAQNTFVRLNKQFGKLETLHLWGIPWMSWAYLIFVLSIALTMAIIPLRLLFIVFCLDAFTRHFRYPDGAANRFWENIPSNMAKFDVFAAKKNV